MPLESDEGTGARILVGEVRGVGLREVFLLETADEELDLLDDE